jgi:hypothetical protein
MELPDDLLALVHDFSRPATRPDWRTLRRMTSYRFHSDILNLYNERNRRPKVIYTFVRDYDQDKFTYMFDYTYKPVAYLRLSSSLQN